MGTKIVGPSIALAKLVTALPASPVDGQEIYYVADATNGVVWHLVYRAADASAYKWNFVGGSPLRHMLDEGINTAYSTTTLSTTATWADLTSGTVGPLVTTPLAGDYMVEYGYAAGWNSAANYSFMTIGVGASGTWTSALLNQRRIETYTSGGWPQSGCAALLLPSLAASTLIQCRYSTDTAGSANFRGPRWLRVQPVRVG